jgi:hypothetical protein
MVWRMIEVLVSLLAAINLVMVLIGVMVLSILGLVWCLGYMDYLDDWPRRRHMQQTSRQRARASRVRQRLLKRREIDAQAYERRRLEWLRAQGFPDGE